MSRSVSCYEGPSLVSNDVCASQLTESQPTASEECNTHDCPAWVRYDWSCDSCEDEGSSGTVSGRVKCEYKGESVSDDLCLPYDPKPSSTKPCEDCPTWHMSDWRSCSKTCGGGVRYRSVTCKEDGEVTYYDDSCDFALKPDNEESCNSHSCPNWVISSYWSSCKDGEDMSTRKITCELNGVTCPDSECGDYSKPFSSQKCPKWVIDSDWSPCSTKCGGGTQTRNVYCEHDGKKAIDSSCAHSPKPLDTQECNVQICRPEWNLGDWECYDCNHGWGTTITTRSVTCKENGVVLADDKCSTYSPKPETVQPCDVCPKWVTGEFGECSQACGRGSRKRSVVCEQEGAIVSDSKCDRDLKPSTGEWCNTHSCPSWNVGFYSECSKKCEGGSQTRNVFCEYQNNVVEDTECSSSTKPISTQACNTLACPEWVIWSESSCSEICGGGTKTRQIYCKRPNDYTYLNEAMCDADLKPETVVNCNEEECPEWSVDSEWSICSAQCGEGTQTRDISCKMDGAVVAESRCVQSKPELVRVCEEAPCGTWQIGNWSDCNSKCNQDEGYSTRKVVCVDENGVGKPDSDCSHETKPSIKISCGVPYPCYEYVIGDWSECSAKCGEGIQTREIKCESSDEIVPIYQCEQQSTKPASEQVCVLKLNLQIYKTKMF
eukprot:TRINITY_DN8579_c0_g1_i1.p2 TRINITY_DN8579_c0_g1~~TRINITY_DN8579_c0_g1_i1.p2  ORF type:complete len:660 (-),score=117.57 TRINITY_DN8579_c0_g1_i1:44-2023(-)